VRQRAAAVARRAAGISVCAERPKGHHGSGRSCIMRRMAERPLTSIALATRAGAVAERLRELIRSGELAPGTHLRQDEFAARFGVSTTPVREAFVALEREGLVRRHAHRGVVVFTPSVEKLIELYEIRAALEPLAAEIAAKKLSEHDLAALDRIVAEMRNAGPKRYLELNSELHNRIYAAADRPRLRELIDGLREQSAAYVAMNADVYDRAYRDQVQAEHEALVGALRSRAPKRVARAMRLHLENSGTHIVSLIEQAAASERARAAS
jgi:DNA-binding GntR family transcriptional regulator